MSTDKVGTVSAEFNACHQRWRECICGTDINTLEKQIQRIAERNAVWAVLNESRKYAAKKEDGTLQISGLLQQFIDECFWESQLSAIRKLGDSSFGLTGAKSVYSLGALVKDLRQNQTVLTRANLMAVVGLPYDHSERQKKYENNLLEQLQRNPTQAPRGGACSRDMFPWEILSRHELIDSYCGNTLVTRNPDDIVGMTRLGEWATGLNNAVSQFATKMFSHAATPESRSQLQVLRYCDIIETWRELVKIAHEIGEFLGIPVQTKVAYQVDALENMEVPLIPVDKKEQLINLFHNCTLYCKSPFGDVH